MGPRRISARRLLFSAVGGALTGASAGAIGVPWQLTALCAWIGLAAVFVALVWRTVLRADSTMTARLATVEDDTRTVASALVVSSAVVSLVGAGLALRAAAAASDALQAVLTVAALMTVVVSWLVVNTEYALRYARQYFTPPVGGVEFPGRDAPDYRDFAYLAFTIGMTYQVSDTGLRTPQFRRTLLGHALLSYLFGTVIVATIINIVASFVR